MILTIGGFPSSLLGSVCSIFSSVMKISKSWILPCIFKLPQVPFFFFLSYLLNGNLISAICKPFFFSLVSNFVCCQYLGKRYPGAGTVSWLSGVDEFVAGMKATVLILPKDPFGNTISSATEGVKESYNFSLSISHINASVASVLNITDEGWNHLGYLSIEFIVAMSGSFLLNVQEQTETLIGSPLPLEVKPGDTCKHGFDDSLCFQCIRKKKKI